MAVMVNHIVVMGMEQDNAAFLIKNPFEKKQKDNNVVLTLDPLIRIEYDCKDQKKRLPRRQFRVPSKKALYDEKFKKNKDNKFMCPYNCPEDYTNKRGDVVAVHVKARHDENFDIRTFDSEKVDLNAYILLVQSKKNKYVDVFEKNEIGRFMCPYNCPDNYVSTRGADVIQHIRARHDKGFDLQTFDKEKIDTDVYIPRKRGRRDFEDIFEKNENDEFMCPYNCPDDYAHKKGQWVMSHIRKRHDQTVTKCAFDRHKLDPDAYIPKVELKKYVDVFEKNENDTFRCPYNNCQYAKPHGSEVVVHIRRRHNKLFNLQTFNRENENLNAYIPLKKNCKRYGDVFEKNKKKEFKCPYNCPDRYAHKRGKDVLRHIKRRHDSDFDLQTFNQDMADLNAWIPRKRCSGIKRKRKELVEKDTQEARRKKKKRKMRI